MCEILSENIAYAQDRLGLLYESLRSAYCELWEHRATGTQVFALLHMELLEITDTYNRGRTYKHGWRVDEVEQVVEWIGDAMWLICMDEDLAKIKRILVDEQRDPRGNPIRRITRDVEKITQRTIAKYLPSLLKSRAEMSLQDAERTLAFIYKTLSKDKFAKRSSVATEVTKRSTRFGCISAKKRKCILRFAGRRQQL